MGWSFYLLKKTGEIVRIQSQPSLITTFEIDLSQIGDLDQYARSSDGYLRGRLNYNFLSETPAMEYINGVGWQSVSNYAQYFFINYGKPAKPSFSLKTNDLKVSTYAQPDLSPAEVEFCFSNVPCNTDRYKGQVVQKEKVGRTTVTSYYNVDLPSLTYVAPVSRLNTTTLQLIVETNGEYAYSDIITYNPNTAYSLPVMNLDVSNDDLCISFKDSNENEIFDLEIQDGDIIGVASTRSVMKITDKTVDINALPKGVYGVTVKDKEGNVYNTKFVK